jgi:hypothetical protein
MSFGSTDMDIHAPLLVRILKQPAAAAVLDAAAWGLLLRQARTANVLGRTLAAVDMCIPSANWPLRAQQLFLAERNLADHRLLSLRWEVDGLSRVLAAADIRIILLKGAAYALDEHPFARYRHFGDIDILVPRLELPDVERLLNVSGWLTTKLDAYDQHYYRAWMHELPPMQHLHRGTNLDVHHAILPLTARYKPDSRLLIEAAREARGLPAVDVLSPSDMFLHAAAHLFCEGEYENALRNLLDLHDLLKEFSSTGQLSVQELVNRSIDLDLTVILALSARYLERIFGLETAKQIGEALKEQGQGGRNTVWLDWIFDAAFLGFHPSYQPSFLTLARLTLYLRGHYLRMPLGLLAVHLVRKAWRGERV